MFCGLACGEGRGKLVSDFSVGKIIKVFLGVNFVKIWEKKYQLKFSSSHSRFHRWQIFATPLEILLTELLISIKMKEMIEKFYHSLFSWSKSTLFFFQFGFFRVSLNAEVEPWHELISVSFVKDGEFEFFEAKQQKISNQREPSTHEKFMGRDDHGRNFQKCFHFNLTFSKKIFNLLIFQIFRISVEISTCSNLIKS